jgi:hypothetical protein
MQTIINYQMSVFGEFRSYEPTLERMNALAKTPSELNVTMLPSTANIVMLDGIPLHIDLSLQGEIPPSKVLRCIQMVDTSEKISLLIMPERIDMNFAQQKYDNAEQLDDISLQAFKLLKHAISVVNEKYWRIAINLAIQSDDDSSDGNNVSILHNALTIPLRHQSDKESVEWQIMSNCPQDVQWGAEQSEKLNVISIISRQTNVTSGLPFFITQLDVNTSATNREPRFDDEKLEYFYTSTIEIIKEILGDIEEKWKND